MGNGWDLRRDAVGRLRSSLTTSLFRNSFFLLATSGFGSVLGFLFWLVVARSYAAADVGVTSALYGVILLLASASTLGLTFAIIRFLPTEPDRPGFVNGALVASGVASLVLGVVFLLGQDLWAPALDIASSDLLLAAATVLSILAFAWASILDTAFVATRRADYQTLRNIVFGLIRLPLPLLVAAALGLLGIFVSWIVALAFSLALGAFVLLPRVLPGYRPALTLAPLRGKGIVGYSLWNHAAAIVGAIPMSLLPLVILNTPGPAGGAEPSAYFFIAASIAAVIYVVPGAFTTSLFVEGSHPEARYARDTRITIAFSLALLALAILAAVVLGRWILELFGAAYSSAGYATLVLLALASPLILANYVFVTHLRVDKRVRPIFWVTTLASAATLVLAFALLPVWGIAGAAAAYALGQGIAVPLFAIERGRNGRSRGGASA